MVLVNRHAVEVIFMSLCFALLCEGDRIIEWWNIQRVELHVKHINNWIRFECDGKVDKWTFENRLYRTDYEFRTESETIEQVDGAKFEWDSTRIDLKKPENDRYADNNNHFLYIRAQQDYEGAYTCWHWKRHSQVLTPLQEYFSLQHTYGKYIQEKFSKEALLDHQQRFLIHKNIIVSPWNYFEDYWNANGTDSQWWVELVEERMGRSGPQYFHHNMTWFPVLAYFAGSQSSYVSYGLPSDAYIIYGLKNSTDIGIIRTGHVDPPFRPRMLEARFVADCDRCLHVAFSPAKPPTSLVPLIYRVVVYDKAEKSGGTFYQRVVHADDLTCCKNEDGLCLDEEDCVLVVVDGFSKKERYSVGIGLNSTGVDMIDNFVETIPTPPEITGNSISIVQITNTSFVLNVLDPADRVLDTIHRNNLTPGEQYVLKSDKFPIPIKIRTPVIANLSEPAEEEEQRRTLEALEKEALELEKKTEESVKQLEAIEDELVKLKEIIREEREKGQALKRYHNQIKKRWEEVYGVEDDVNRETENFILVGTTVAVVIASLIFLKLHGSATVKKSGESKRRKSKRSHSRPSKSGKSKRSVRTSAKASLKTKEGAKSGDGDAVPKTIDKTTSGETIPKSTETGESGKPVEKMKESGKVGETVSKTKEASKSGETLPKTREATKSGETLPKTKEATKSGETLPKTKEATKSGETLPKTKEATKSGETLPKTKEVTKSGETVRKTKEVSKSGESVPKSKKEAKMSGAQSKSK